MKTKGESVKKGQPEQEETQGPAALRMGSLGGEPVPGLPGPWSDGSAGRGWLCPPVTMTWPSSEFSSTVSHRVYS